MTQINMLVTTKLALICEGGEDADEGRTGVFTSGIVATGAGHRIALFFTGVRHAGENLAAVLEQRAEELPAPIQMCDGLSSNTAGDFQTLLSNCNAHARRKYVEVAAHFPEEVRFVLEQLGEVYKIDAEARSKGLPPEQRLQLHQEKSGPRMAAIEQWMRTQFDERRVEPNSGLGQAMRYMQAVGCAHPVLACARGATGHWTTTSQSGR